jgi:hypothetical protein
MSMALKILDQFPIVTIPHFDGFITRSSINDSIYTIKLMEKKPPPHRAQVIGAV